MNKTRTKHMGTTVLIIAMTALLSVPVSAEETKITGPAANQGKGPPPSKHERPAQASGEKGKTHQRMDMAPAQVLRPQLPDIATLKKQAAKTKGNP